MSKSGTLKTSGTVSPFRQTILVLPFYIFLMCSCATPSVLVNREQKLGDDYFNRYQYEQAAKHYSIMIGASRKLGIYRNLQTETVVRRKLADCFEMTGKYDTALVIIKEALILDSLEKNLLGSIEDYRQMGMIFTYSGSFRDAIKSLEKSLALGEGMDLSIKNVNKTSLAETYLALGQLYEVTGRIGDSQKLAVKALELFEQVSDKKGKMESFLTLGSAWADIGELNAAKNFTLKSLELANELGMGTARQYNLLASISDAAGEYEDALKYQERAVDDANRVRVTGQIVWTTIGMGDIYRDLGDLKKAMKLYKTAREIKDTSTMKKSATDASLNLRLGDMMSANRYFAKEGSASGEGISSLRIAEIMINDRKHDSAILFLDKGERLFRSTGNKQGLANIQLLKGSLLVDSHQFEKAKPLLDSASSYTEFPETKWQACYHLGRLYEGLNLDDKAIESYRKSISVIEKIRGNLTVDEFKSIFFENKRDVYDRLIKLLIRENRSLESFQVSEQARARAFYDIMAGKKINYRSSPPGDLVMQEQEKRLEIRKLYLLLQMETPGPREKESRMADLRQIRSSLEEKQMEYESILQKMKLYAPFYSDLIMADPVALSDVQSILAGTTGLITYWVSGDELIMWLITKGGILERSVGAGQREIVSLVETARRAIRGMQEAEERSSLSKLYALLIGPVESELSGITDLVIVPNSGLHFLPFQALIDPDGKYLVERFNFVYAPSAGVYSLCMRKNKSSGSGFMGMAIGNVAIGNNVRLPGTEDELMKILPLFGIKIFALGNECSESFIRENSGKYSFIHFATHGIYNFRQPLYSCLLFPPGGDDDGRLNVYEVFELNLNSKLVTLSACETGLGNTTQGDEITGLSRAFLYAGSSAVMVSLWSIADYPTALLMSDFYKYSRDHPFQEALTMAQRDVIKLYPQPVYWSPFILIGNGTQSGI